MQTTITTDTKLTQTQAEILVTLAHYNLNVAATARKLFMHRNTVDYHVRMILRNTGKNPLVFYDLVDLLADAKQVLGGE